MARARNIKPGFFKNEILVEESLFVRMLFIGLWTLADREGRVEDRPKRIKLELFPYDVESVDDGLQTLAENGFIERYEASGVKVISIINFLKHQTPHGTERDSELPGKDGAITVNERGSNGYVTGTKRNNNVKNEPNNVNPPLEPVNPPCDNTLNPDSLNPDSPIPIPSEAKASGGKPPLITDPAEIIFGYGLPMLTNAGTAEKQARSFLGGLRKQHGEAALIDKLRECAKAKPLQPLEWLAAALPPGGVRASPGKHAGFANLNYTAGIEADGTFT